MAGALPLVLALVAAPGGPVSTVVLEAEAFEVVELETTDLAPRGAAEQGILSGGAWVAEEGLGPEPRRLATTFTVTTTGAYTLYARTFWKHGPFTWQLDDRPPKRLGSDRVLLDCAVVRTKVSACWVRLGGRELTPGTHRLQIVVEGNAKAVGFDVFQLSTSIAIPRGAFGLVDAARPPPAPGWVRFDPGPPPMQPPVWQSAFDRAPSPRLEARDGRLVRADTGRPWPMIGVNIGADLAAGREQEKVRFAGFATVYGVNFVRVHGRLFDARLRIPPDTAFSVRHTVRILSAYGIHTQLSPYFAAWLPDGPGLPGYPKRPPYGAVFVDPELERRYLRWWQALLTLRANESRMPPGTMLELVNEDSLLFGTFDPVHLPPKVRRKLERDFATFAADRRGGLAAAVKAYETSGGDQIEDGRLEVWSALRIAETKDSLRAADTAVFLAGKERAFYDRVRRFITEDLDFSGLVVASNWTTADPRRLESLELDASLAGDLLDHHGYHAPDHRGPRATFAIDADDRFRPRPALSGPSPVGPPMLRPTWGGRPRFMTEVGWPAPNPFQYEAPLTVAVYAAALGLDGVAFYRATAPEWDASPDKFAFGTPSQLGQLPAAALILRQGLLPEAPTVARVTVTRAQMERLESIPFGAAPSVDPFRLKDLGAWLGVRASSKPLVPPLAFLMGPVRADVGPEASVWIDPRVARRLPEDGARVPTLDGRVVWDRVQGTLHAEGPGAAVHIAAKPGGFALGPLAVETERCVGAWALVALDGQPLATSTRMLLQVGTEERRTGAVTKRAGKGARRYVRLGHAPFQRRPAEGRLALDQPSARDYRVTALDDWGRPAEPMGTGARFGLQPHRFSYLIERKAR